MPQLSLYHSCPLVYTPCVQESTRISLLDGDSGQIKCNLVGILVINTIDVVADLERFYNFLPVYICSDRFCSQLQPMREHHRRTEGSVASEGPSHGDWSLPRDNSMTSSPNIDYFDDETPRHSMELDRLVSWVPPASPVGNRKTRSRAGPFIPRTDSLRESKVL